MSDAVLRFIGQDQGLAAQFAKANQHLSALEGQASRASSTIGKGFATAAGVIGAISFARLASEAFDYAESLKVASSRTGIQVEALQKLQFIASQSETSVDAITTSINKFQVNLVEGNEKARGALDRLGISIGDLQALKPDQQFIKIAEAVAEIHDPATRAATAVEIFGKGGSELLPLLSQGAAGVAELAKQFDDLGFALSEEAVKKIDELGDAFGRLKVETKSLVSELVALSQPLLQPLTEGAENLIRDIRILSGAAPKVAEIDAALSFLHDQQGGVGVLAVGKSLFNPQGGVTFLNEDEIDRQVASLERLRDVTVSLAKAPHFEDVRVDPNQLEKLEPQKASVSRLPGLFEDSPQGRRESNIMEDPLVKAAIDEKDLITAINQEKLDALLEQETKGILERTAAVTQGSNVLLDISQSLTDRLIDMESFKKDFTVDANKATTDLVIGSLDVLFAHNKNYAIAMATIAAIGGAARALHDYQYPYSLIIAAATLATGFARVQQIRSVSHRGGGGGSVSSSGGGSVAGSAPLAAAATPTPDSASSSQSVLQVYINGPIAGPDAARWLIDELKELVDGRDVVVFSGKSAQAQIIRQGG